MKKDEIINTLECIRSTRVCTYATPICDCKYGIVENGLTRSTAFFHVGEKTGCPEMRDIINQLKEMPEEVFEDFVTDNIQKAGWKKVSSIGGHEHCHGTPDDVIDRMQEVRSDNNKLWMGLLKLAFKYAPQEAKAIMANITFNDGKISNLCKQI